MPEKRPQREGFRSTQRAATDSRELKFVEVTTDDESGGGWYRELDDTQIEVLARARLERVEVEGSTDVESTARGKIAEMMKTPPARSGKRAH